MKDRILEIMKKQGMSQQEFSRATGIPPASLSSIFNGRTAPTMKHAEALHRHFPALSMDWLLFGEGEMFVKTGGEEGADDELQPSEDGLGTLDADFFDDTFTDQEEGGYAAAGGGVLPASQGARRGATGSENTVSQNAAGSQQNNFVRNSASSGKGAQNASRRGEMSRYVNNSGNTANNAYSGMDGMPNFAEFRQRKIVEIRIFFDDGTFETFKGN